MKVNFNTKLKDLYGRPTQFLVEPPMLDPNDPNRYIKAAVTRPMTLGDLGCICLDNGKDHPEVKGKKRTTYLLQKAMLEQPEDSDGVDIPIDAAALLLKLVDDQQPPSVFGFVEKLLDPKQAPTVPVVQPKE